MNGLVKGRIVYFVVDAINAEQILRRRTDPSAIAERLQAIPPTWPRGAQAHIGNTVVEGDILPAMVTAVYSDTCVNLKVFLDGSDVYWLTSVLFHGGDTEPATPENPSPVTTYRPMTWHWMFTEQATRYTPNEAQILDILASVIEGDNGVVRNIAREEAEKLAHRIGEHFAEGARQHGVDRAASAGDVNYRAQFAAALQTAENLVSRHGDSAAYVHLRADLRRLLEAWPE